MDATKRRFIQAALMWPAALTLPAWARENADAPRIPVPGAFLTPDEYRFVEAATAHLIPGDEQDPGAVEAGIPLFIDLQLAGSYGRADRWYMQGPWASGTDSQGYQLKQTPAELYRIAIAGIDTYCRHQFDDQVFADLPAQQQERVLLDLEAGKIELPDVPAKAFFQLLWQNTQEGFLADPMYGGNRDFAGWRLIGFPGPRYNYVEEITQYGKPYPMPPVGILGRNGRRIQAGA